MNSEHIILPLNFQRTKCFTRQTKKCLSMGVIHKVGTLRFHNFRPPLPPVGAHTILAYILFFKGDMTRYIFCELLSIKGSQTTLQNKETNVQSYGKMSNQNTRKVPGIEFSLFNCTGETEMGNFGYLHSSLPLFLFCNEPAIKFCGARTPRAETTPQHSNTNQVNSSKWNFQISHNFL